MFDLFKWSGASARRNMAMAEYEPIQPYFLMALAEKEGCRTFLDVGANVGAYSVFAFQVPTIKRVIAFEANPKAADEIRPPAVRERTVQTHRSLQSASGQHRQQANGCNGSIPDIRIFQTEPLTDLA